ncbi:LuxR family transcriptional regulator [Streptomyces sp. NPDC052309]|uniref:LuxR family transcriptional regulator n=1 Tax=Streptomyces sp. NPDC052309 TaxID=3155421 RepID=UPI0034203308
MGAARRGRMSGPPLTGRDVELAVVESALAGVRSAGSAVVLRGDPGIGKTALLRWAGATAGRAGLRVVWMTGTRAETALPFAALHQVLWPLFEDAGALPGRQRRALECALGLREEAAPEGNAVAEASLALLARAAARGPLLVLLDDLQWADPSSAEVFAFVQRRPAALPLVVIGATRHRSGAVAGRLLDLEPLDDDHAGRLLAALHPRLTDRARRRVLEAAGGNPLALGELPVQMERAPAAFAVRTDPDGSELLGELPLGERLGRLYEDEIRALPDGARRALLPAALGGPAATGAGREAWRSVVDSGLAKPDPDTGRVEFRHPLVRAGLLHLASPAERREAHRLLARTLPVDSPARLVHLAAAAVGTDDALAALLHAEADRLAARGGEGEAAGMTARAAGLTSDPATRVRRLVAAAALAARGGRPGLALQLTAEAESETGARGLAASAPYAFAVAYARLHLAGDPGPSVELLPAALDLLTSAGSAETRVALLDAMLFLLVVVAVHFGDERAWAAVERHAAGASELTGLCCRAWAGVPHVPDDVPARLRAAAASLPKDRRTAAARLLLWTATAVDAVGDHAALWRRAAPHHAYATQAFIAYVRVHDDFLHGRWDEALAVSRQEAGTAAAHGHVFIETLFACTAGQVLAARGERAGLAELEPVLGAAARERGMRFAGERLRGLRALCALGQGRSEDAWQQVRALTPPGVVPPRAPWFHLTLLDFVQAAVATGRRAEARLHLRAVRAASVARTSPHHAFLVAAAEALAASDDEADARCRAVYAVPGADQWPFELARVRLAHGAWLRRRARRKDAAACLRAALAVFTRLGAVPWAEQATRELDAAGSAEEPGGGRTHPLLSAQESRIAELVAEGLTNREIGERLRLSPRTVGAHLYKIFPKLGVTTRARVAGALEETRATGVPDGAGPPSGT